MMKVLTVKEAVKRVNEGGDLKDVVLDESTIMQVNVRDAMALARGGIVIPEQNIYYNDDEIEYDEDIDELVIAGEIVELSWDEKAKRAEAFNATKTMKKEVMVNLSTQKPEIDDWILINKEKIELLLKPIVVNLFNAEKAVSK